MKIKKKMFDQMVDALEDASHELGMMNAMYPGYDIDVPLSKVKKSLRRAYKSQDRRLKKCSNDAPSTM